MILSRLKDNAVYRLLAILIAVGLWLWVTVEKNPTQERVFQVPLETKNVASGYMVGSKLDDVKVRVEGRRKLIDNMSTRDIQAYADLSNAHPGKNIVPIEVSLPFGVELISTSPSQTSLFLDQTRQIQLPVHLNTTGKPLAGYNILEAVLKPSVVIVEGPKTILDSIERVFIEVDSENKDASIDVVLPIKVRNKEGKDIQDLLNIKPEYVSTYIPIIKESYSKKVTVKPKLTGKLPAGYKISRIDIEPEIIDIYGDYNELQDINFVETEEISVNDLKEDKIITAKLVFPENKTEIINRTVTISILVEKN